MRSRIFNDFSSSFDVASPFQFSQDFASFVFASLMLCHESNRDKSWIYRDPLRCALRDLQSICVYLWIGLTSLETFLSEFLRHWQKSKVFYAYSSLNPISFVIVSSLLNVFLVRQRFKLLFVYLSTYPISELVECRHRRGEKLQNKSRLSRKRARHFIRVLFCAIYHPTPVKFMNVQSRKLFSSIAP